MKAKQKLIELADRLDSKGLTEEVNELDKVIQAGFGDEYAEDDGETYDDQDVGDYGNAKSSEDEEGEDEDEDETL